jgi:sterol desaturase/sphingolipid hydroxylase (fatty acid hydroxylase superfamily)
LLPFDRLFGTWHDGTKEGDRKMQERFKQRMALNNQNVSKGME